MPFEKAPLAGDDNRSASTPDDTVAGSFANNGSSDGIPISAISDGPAYAPADASAGNLARDLARILSDEEAIDLLVGDAVRRRRGQRMRAHVWSTDFPPMSFAKIAPHVQISSPEFLFLQMSRTLSLLELVQLGYELCGTYALDPSNSRGFCSRRKSLTTQRKIVSYLDKFTYAKGLNKAKRAAKLIVDGSASPMETALSMILCLPIRLGGYGFESAVLNKPLVLSFRDPQQNITRTRQCRCDLLWPDRHLAIEYESDLEHLSSRKFSEDSMRRNDLTATNFTVLTVTKHQILNLAYWPTLAHHVEAILRVKPRIRIPDHRDRQRKLYAQLFGSLFEQR